LGEKFTFSLKAAFLLVCLGVIFKGIIFAQDISSQTDNYWRELAAIEKQISENHLSLEKAREKIRSYPSTITFSGSYNDSSLGVNSSSFYITMGTVFRQYLNPQLSNIIKFTQYKRFAPVGSSTSLYDFSLSGNTKLLGNKLSYSLGDFYLGFSPLVVGSNPRVETLANNSSAKWRRIKGLQINTQIASLGVNAWFAKRPGHLDDIILGATTNLELVPGLNTNLLFYNISDKEMNTSLLGLTTKRKINFKSLMFNINFEYNLSINDKDYSDSLIPIYDKALVFDVATKHQVLDSTIPLNFEYRYIGPNYLTNIYSSFTGVLPAISENYIYQQPEENPYTFDYHLNQQGTRIKVGPIKIYNLSLDLNKNDHQDIISLVENTNPRTFNQLGGSLVWKLPGVPKRTDIFITYDKYDTKRQAELAEQNINVSLDKSNIGFSIDVTRNRKLQMEKEVLKTRGNLEMELKDCNLITNRITYTFPFGPTSVSSEVGFGKVEGVAYSHNELKIKIKTTTILSGSTLKINGTFNHIYTPNPTWTTALTISHNLVF